MEMEREDVDKYVDKNIKSKTKREQIINNLLFKDNECEYSVYFFSQSDDIRKNIMNLISWKRFDQFIMLIILISTLRLIIDTFVSSYNTDLVFDYILQDATRVVADETTKINKGKNQTFEFKITRPDDPGSYSFVYTGIFNTDVLWCINFEYQA